HPSFRIPYLFFRSPGNPLVGLDLTGASQLQQLMLMPAKLGTQRKSNTTSQRPREWDRPVDESEPSPPTSEQRLSSWEEFQQHAAAFDDPTRKRWDEVWFRGQSVAEWPLSTSLERRWKKTRAIADYLNIIGEI